MPIRRHPARFDGAVVNDPAAKTGFILVVTIFVLVTPDQLAIEPRGQKRAVSGTAPPRKQHFQKGHSPHLLTCRLVLRVQTAERIFTSQGNAREPATLFTSGPQEFIACGRKILRTVRDRLLTPAVYERSAPGAWLQYVVGKISFTTSLLRPAGTRAHTWCLSLIATQNLAGALSARRPEGHVHTHFRRSERCPQRAAMTISGSQFRGSSCASSVFSRSKAVRHMRVSPSVRHRAKSAIRTARWFSSRRTLKCRRGGARSAATCLRRNISEKPAFRRP